MKYLAVLLTLALTAPALGQLVTEPRLPTSGKSLSKKKQHLLALLEGLSDPKNPQWLVGQNAGHSNFNIRAEYQRSVTRLQRTTSKLPSLLGVDLGYEEIPRQPFETLRILRAHAQQGGVVSLSMHPRNPFRNSGCQDVRPVNWGEVTVSGYYVQKRWQQTLDRVASILAELQNDGIVVLWRPFHEMNGGWFWWCARDRQNQWTSREQFVALWRHMHDDFENRGLDNLLWVFAPAVQTNAGQRPANYYYPGDRYVDVVGLDWYDDRLQNLDDFDSYQQLSRLGKPMGLTEFGPQAGDGQFDGLSFGETMKRYPRLGFALFWHGWEGRKMALVQQKHAKELVTSQEAVTLDELSEQIAEKTDTP